jgi:hypothetical protein
VFDPYLAAVVRAVEDGAELPAIWISLMSGDLVTGTPRPSREFVEGTTTALAREAREAPPPPGDLWGLMPPSKDAMAAASSAAQARLRDVANSLAAESESSDGLAITLSNATVLWGGHGAGVRVDVVRLNLNAIALWWLAGGRAFKGDTASFFGVALPLG